MAFETLPWRRVNLVHSFVSILGPWQAGEAILPLGKPWDLTSGSNRVAAFVVMISRVSREPCPHLVTLACQKPLVPGLRAHHDVHGRLLVWHAWERVVSSSGKTKARLLLNF